MPIPQSGCVPSWDVVDYPCSYDGHRELRRVRGLGSRHRPLTAVRPGLVSGAKVHRDPERSILTPRLQVCSARQIAVAGWGGCKSQGWVCET